MKNQSYRLFLFSIDESRIAEISKQLQTQHEKFCPWPDFPCPGKNDSTLCVSFKIVMYHIITKK